MRRHVEGHSVFEVAERWPRPFRVCAQMWQVAAGNISLSDIFPSVLGDKSISHIPSQTPPRLLSPCSLLGMHERGSQVRARVLDIGTIPKGPPQKSSRVFGD